VSVGALYVIPSITNTDYLGVAKSYSVDGAVDPTINKRNWQHYRVDPGYDWGFTVGVGYVMAGGSKDARVDWTHFNSDDSNSVTIIGDEDVSKTVALFPLGFESVGTSTALDNPTLDEFAAKGKMKYRFDAVDFTLGQYINVGKCLQVRKFAGIRYARLDSDLSTYYTLVHDSDTGGQTPILNRYTWDGKLDSRFNGVGPLAGVSASYGLGYGFGVNAMFDMALLVGQLKLGGSLEADNYSQDANDNWALTSQSNYNLGWDSQVVVAPAFDGSFSLDYGYDMGTGMSFALELGYKVSKYLNVVEQLDRTVAISYNQQQSAEEYSMFDTDVTNFGLNGPFLTLTLRA